MHFDCIIHGGVVIDPASGRNGRFDLAISDGRIAAIDRAIPVEAGAQVIDATDRYVTPGLFDFHTHVYPGATFWGIEPDPIAWRTGVTTWLDAGSAGAFSFGGLRRFIDEHCDVRVFALLNISSIGLCAETGENAELGYCDVDRAVDTATRNRDLIVGFKARFDRRASGENSTEVLRRARAIADACELPLMVHIAAGPPSIDEVVAHLKPGDIITHCYTARSMKIIEDDGTLRESVRRARDAGVLLDVGHGAGGFSFEIAEQVFRGGVAPDIISSDLHPFSVRGPGFDLPTTLSKFLAMGMSLPDVIAAATVHPARAIGVEESVGSLRVGGPADIGLFALDEGQFRLFDAYHAVRETRHVLRNTLTLVGGRALTPKALAEMPPWVELTPKQRTYLQSFGTPTHQAPTAIFTEPADFGSPASVSGSNYSPSAQRADCCAP